jgi:hypothetical protein
MACRQRLIRYSESGLLFLTPGGQPLGGPMNEQSIVRDAYLQRLVRDFDALADVLHDLLDRDALNAEREAISSAAMEFTTEWQMVSTGEQQLS